MIYLCDDEEKVIMELAKRGLQTEPSPPKPKRTRGRPRLYPRHDESPSNKLPSKPCHQSKKLSEEIK